MPQNKKLNKPAETGTPAELGRVEFGRDVLVISLAHVIDQSFEQGMRGTESSLVVGVLGEWGSGKSTVLQHLQDTYRDRMSADKSTVTIPVSFNPWRYEAEAHLIVPLLKTAQVEIRKFEAEIEAAGEKAPQIQTGEGFRGRLKQSATLLGQTAVALATAFSAEMSIPGIGKVRADPKAAIDYLKREENSGGTEEQVDMTLFDSMYFDLHTQLEAITARPKEENGAGISLLFLIDDLDRCLPEKAVQVMESVKLFLDVRGCAFVLALDEEVVERGIAHRYRDYLFEHERSGQEKPEGVSSSGNGVVQGPPITGAEYLEKIIQLPIQLPRPAEGEVRLFLRRRFSHLFDIEKDPSSDAEATSDKGGRRPGSAVFELFVRAVPPVPRKLVRACTLYGFLRQFADDRGIRLQDVTLARLVLLQLFAPELYRFARTGKGFGMLGTLEYWCKQYPDYWRDQTFIDAQVDRITKELQMIRGSLHGTIGVQPEESPDEQGSDLKSASTPERDLAILGYLSRSVESRGEFDPRDLVDSELPSDTGIARYFAFFEEAPAPGTVPKSGRETIKGPADPAQTEAQPAADRPLAQIENLREFIAQLASDREDAWVNAVEANVAAGEALPDEVFDRLLQSLPKTLPGEKWMQLVAPILTTDQLQRLETEKYSRQFAEARKRINSLDADQEWGDNYSPAEGDIKANAEAGLLIGWRDTRPGVGLDNGGLPDIAWTKIKKPGLVYSLKADELVLDEQGEFKLDYDYRIARYPVTWAQFQTFIDHPDGFGSEQARQGWCEAFEIDEKILLSTDAEWPIPNHPRETVNWFQCVAFCRWLTPHFRSLPDEDPRRIDQGEKVMLPSEWEWQFAATGGENELVYPWGKSYREGYANIDETEDMSGSNYLKRSNAVGLYPWGATRHKKSETKLFDMSGNVWEWCRNRGDFDDNERDVRALRGGSWGDGSVNAACRARFRYVAVSRYFNWGFRLVCVPAHLDDR